MTSSPSNEVDTQEGTVWDKILPYVNTGRKLKIKGDKLFVILLQNNFAGTLFVHGATAVDEVIFSGGRIHAKNSPSYFTFAMQGALFSLANTAAPEGEGRDGYEFLYEIVKAYPADMLARLLEPYKGENLTLKPEAGRFSFLKETLQPYAGQASFPVVKLFLQEVHALYFLLLTEDAAILRASDLERQRATEEEKRRLEEEKDAEPEKAIASSPEWRELAQLVKWALKRESIFDLFKWKEGDDLKEAHKTYLSYVQKLHPDRVSRAPEELRDRANDLLMLVNTTYPLLKDDETRTKIIALTKKYGPIRTKERYEEILMVEDLVLRADQLLRIGEPGKAYKIYVEMYGRTKAPWLLEKMIYAYYYNRRPEEDAAKGIKDTRRATPEEKYMKLRDYIQRLRDFKPALPLEILHILADVYEKEKNIVMLKKTLQEILVLYPGDQKALSWLRQVDAFLASRKKP